jgi:hypothetical protein
MKDGLVVLCPVVGCECSETVSVGGHIPDRLGGCCDARKVSAAAATRS